MKVLYSCAGLLLFACVMMNAQTVYTLDAPGAEVDDQSPLAVVDDTGVYLIEGDSKGEKKEKADYKLYKEGYGKILGEEWGPARKIFSELITKFPSSNYADDARYWNAFALKHTDKSKALEEYRKFITDFPSSSYYDEAFNDYVELNHGSMKGLEYNSALHVYTTQAATEAAAVSAADARAAARAGSVTGIRGATAPGASTGFGYSYTIAPSMKMSEQKMRLAERQLSRQMARLTPMRTPVAARPMVMLPGMHEEYDRETRLKMDALYAIGETKEDSISYKTLRDVAIDTKQPRVLRETAMDALANFSHFDVLPVFLEIARQDTSEEIQNMAIDYMGQLSKDKSKSLETLTELFHYIPKSRTTQLQTVLASIAEIGNDKAVDFIAEVARTHEDYELRSDAVYYLGNIGGDKARTALYDILKGH